MQEKRKILLEFLKHLNLAISQANMYFSSHPAFKESVSFLRGNLNNLLAQQHRLRIGIAPDHVVVDNYKYSKDKVIVELARYLHYRKLKAIVFYGGIGYQELVDFLSLIAKPLKEVENKGGVNKLLTNSTVKNIKVENLSYRQLIGRDGKHLEDKQVWKILIQEAAVRKNKSSHNLKDLADNFRKIINSFSAQDVKNDPLFLQNVLAALENIKLIDKDKFKECVEDLVDFTVDEKEMLDHKQIKQAINYFFQTLDNKFIAQQLWRTNFDNNKFDPAVLNIFSRIIDLEQQTTVANQLQQKLKNKPDLFNSSQAKKKFTNLVAQCSRQQQCSPAYLKTLNSFLSLLEDKSTFQINPRKIFNNYKYLLLNLLAIEDRVGSIQKIFLRLQNIWQDLVKNEDVTAIKNFLKTIEAKIYFFKDTDFALELQGKKEKLIDDLEKSVLDNIENIGKENFVSLRELVNRSNYEPEFYIDKIIESRDRQQKRYLDLYFKLFPDKGDLLIKQIKSKISKLNNFHEVLEIAKNINNASSLNLLKEVFEKSDIFLKIEIVAAMDSFSRLDQTFLLEQLHSKSYLLRKEALRVICLQGKAVKEAAARRMLSVFNPVGIKDKFLTQNINIISQIALKEALPELKRLRRKLFLPWQRNLKIKILETINKLES